MKKIYVVYAAVVAGLTLAGMLAGFLTLHESTAPALKKLGRGDREFREARNELVMNTTDPAPLLLDFVTNKKHGTRAREQALTILAELAKHQPLAESGHRLVPLLGEGNRTLLLAALNTLAAFETTEALDSVGSFLLDPDTSVSQAAHRAMRTGSAVFDRTLSRMAIAHNSAGIDSCLELVKKLRMPKQGMYLSASHYFRSTGDSSKAQSYYKRQGAISRWYICGIFGNENWQGINHRYDPETKPFDPGMLFKGVNGKTIGWQPVFTEPNGWGFTWDVWNALEKYAPAVVYLSTTVTAPSDREVFLYSSNMDAVKLWCNDSLIVTISTPGNHLEDEGWGLTRLHKGDNHILAKLGRQDATWWNIRISLTDTYGEGMNDIAFLQE